jgi:hypothetical protein
MSEHFEPQPPNPEDIAWRIAKTTFVIIVKDEGRLNLIVDPGLNRPWSTKSRKFADTVAKECDGMVATYAEAVDLLMKDNPDYEKMLHDRLAQKAKIIDVEQMKHNHKLINQILNDPTKKANLVIPPNDVNPINPKY